jgi:hypothetical protein
MSGFFGIIMSSLQPGISTKSLTAKANKSTSSVDVSSTTNNKGTLTYNWKSSVGKSNRINANTSAETTVTGLDTNEGSTTIYCDITDSVTGVTVSSPEAVITWSAVTTQGVVISGAVTYTGSAQAYTLTGTPATPAPVGTPITFINAGTYVYPTNITSITTDSDYTLGTVSGSFVISPATLTASTRTGSATFNGSSQSVTVLGGINGTFTGSTSVSGINAGSYTTTITGIENYTGSVIGTLTISPATITLQGSGESKTYNGTTQSVGYTVSGSAMNNYSYIISGTSAINAGTYTATITSTTSNYVISPTINSFNWTIHPAPASSSPASGTTIYQGYDGSTKSATVISGLSGLSIVSGSAHVSGVNAGTYPTTITLGGNYSGSITGYLVISQAFGDISLYFGGYVAAGDTNTKVFDDYLQRANARYTWSASVSGPGARDAYIQEGFGVESTNYATSGFVVTITATISDPNYGASSATTSITFEAYVPPRDGGGGFIAE